MKILVELTDPVIDRVLVEGLDDDVPLTRDVTPMLEERLQPLFKRYKTDFVLTGHFVQRVERSESSERIMFNDVIRCVAGCMATTKLQKLVGRNLSEWRLNPLSLMLIDYEGMVKIPVGVHYLDTPAQDPNYNRKNRQTPNRQEFRPITVWKGFGGLMAKYSPEHTVEIGEPNRTRAAMQHDIFASYRAMAKSMGHPDIDDATIQAAHSRASELIRGGVQRKQAIGTALRSILRAS